jgi:hypothetical protein
MTPHLSPEDAVDVTPLREHFIRMFNRGELNATLVAERLGWYDRGRPDETKVLRALGLRPVQDASRGGRRVSRYRTRLEYGKAALLAEAMHMDFHEAGV